MALVTCEECGKEISSEAVACPHCGRPMEVVERGEGLFLRSLNFGCGLVLVVTAFLAAVIIGIVMNASNK